MYNLLQPRNKLKATKNYNNYNSLSPTVTKFNIIYGKP